MLSEQAESLTTIHIIVHFRYFIQIKLFVYVYSMTEKNLEFLASTKEDTVYIVKDMPGIDETHLNARLLI